MKLLITLLVFFIFYKDVTAQQKPKKTKTTSIDKRIVEGNASFYSTNLTGTITATGETFNNNEMTAASNSFKLRTWVKVINLSNNKSVIVRITDRMHKRMAKKGRVIDLSRAAAKKLNFIKKGVTTVQVYEVAKPVN